MSLHSDRKSSPMIRVVVDATQELIAKADNYARQWAAERGEVVYKQILQL